ncbi:Cof-type HAD-IIB family hydrolase [Bacillus sp. FSL K6-3431]|uniref:Cof-type HAD-IIB family hydrolase n=1 Tax=Bacillus sp. FSL K6-3431 TaxID=2921500 RepID=UPI0030F853D2
MKKIVFFDIDGTLLDHQKNLPASTKEAIFTLQKNGIYTAIATGRGPFMFSYLLKELNIKSYVSFNGQYVVSGNEVLYKNPFKRTDLKKLAEESTKRNQSLVYMNENTLKANIKFDQRIADSMKSLEMPHPEFDQKFYEKNEIYQTLLFARQEESTYLEAFEDRFDFIRWHEEALDVVPKGGSKAEGIKKMIDVLGFKMENVYAFGDGLNDIEMLKTVGTGVAMGNAHVIVKTYADFVTTDVDDDGIVNGLKEVGLLSSAFETIK